MSFEGILKSNILGYTDGGKDEYAVLENTNSPGHYTRRRAEMISLLEEDLARALRLSNEGEDDLLMRTKRDRKDFAPQINTVCAGSLDGRGKRHRPTCPITCAADIVVDEVGGCDVFGC